MNETNRYPHTFFKFLTAVFTAAALSMIAYDASTGFVFGWLCALGVVLTMTGALMIAAVRGHSETLEAQAQEQARAQTKETAEPRAIPRAKAV